MRTNVEVTKDVHETELKAGDKGYIDGYVQVADSRPYAVVVVLAKGLVELAPTHALKPIGFC